MEFAAKKLILGVVLFGTVTVFAASVKADKPQDVIRRELVECTKIHPDNPGTINCNQTAIDEADKAIQDSVDYIKSHILVGDASSILDQQVKAFQAYRKSSGAMSAVANGGTGSDMQVADTSTQAELSLRELQDIREQFSLDQGS